MRVLYIREGGFTQAKESGGQNSGYYRVDALEETGYFGQVAKFDIDDTQDQTECCARQDEAQPADQQAGQTGADITQMGRTFSVAFGPGTMLVAANISMKYCEETHLRL